MYMKHTQGYLVPSNAPECLQEQHTSMVHAFTVLTMHAVNQHIISSE